MAVHFAKGYIEKALKAYCEKRQTEKAFGSMRHNLANAADRIGRAAAAFAYGLKFDCKLAGFGFTLDTSKAAAREEELARYREKKARAFSDTLTSIYYDIINELNEAVDENQFRIVAFIDDLDRCLPEKAVELLEAIKLLR